MEAAAALLLYAIRYRATEPQPKLLRSDVVAYTLCLVCVILVAGGVAMIMRGLLQR
jgi:hypothetical protein